MNKYTLEELNSMDNFNINLIAAKYYLFCQSINYHDARPICDWSEEFGTEDTVYFTTQFGTHQDVNFCSSWEHCGMLIDDLKITLVSMGDYYDCHVLVNEDEAFNVSASTATKAATLCYILAKQGGYHG